MKKKLFSLAVVFVLVLPMSANVFANESGEVVQGARKDTAEEERVYLSAPELEKEAALKEAEVQKSV